MYILWVDTYDTTALVQQGRTMRIHRAAIDLAQAFNDKFGLDLSTHSEDHLQDEMRHLPNDELLEYRLIDRLEGENTRTEIRLTSRNIGKKPKGDPPYLAWRRSAASHWDRSRIVPFLARAESLKAA